MTNSPTGLARNSMTVVELTGPALEHLRAEVGSATHTFRLAIEVEPDGAAYFKAKPDEHMWTPPLEVGVTISTDTLYG